MVVKMIFIILFLICIILIIHLFYFLKKTSPEQSTALPKTSLPEIQINMKFDCQDKPSTIPKVVYLTYHDLKKIPKYVISNLKKYCHGFDIRIFDDAQCIAFLKQYFGQEAVSIFNNMKVSAHKADFWRYCILYVFGGYYFDIKTEFKAPLSEIFDSTEKNTWYTVLSKIGGTIYNGIIATPPINPILYQCIQHVFQNKNPHNYLTFVTYLYSCLQNSVEGPLKIGNNPQKTGWNCILFKETCLACQETKCNRKPDRYNLNCNIHNENKKLLFYTRYPDFPWV